MNQQIIDSFAKIVGNSHLFPDEPMKKHTTFRIGGPADLLVKPQTEEALIQVIQECHKENIPFMVMGNGSNMLVSDKGIRGVVIMLMDNYSKIIVKDNIITAQSGALLSQIGAAALAHELTGFEFACGIPGTLGGACTMNAGAYGGEMKDVLLSVRAMDENGCIEEYKNYEMELSYRKSVFSEKNRIIISAEIELKPGKAEEIQAQMKDLAFRRREKQPLELPSAGSTFKRPEGYFAGKLIMDAGLRGCSVGGAAVSEKHCGFVVNTGNATAADVCTLMKLVSDKVYELNGVKLEPEIKLVGEMN